MRPPTSLSTLFLPQAVIPSWLKCMLEVCALFLRACLCQSLCVRLSVCSSVCASVSGAGAGAVRGLGLGAAPPTPAARAGQLPRLLMWGWGCRPKCYDDDEDDDGDDDDDDEG